MRTGGGRRKHKIAKRSREVPQNKGFKKEVLARSRQVVENKELIVGKPSGHRKQRVIRQRWVEKLGAMTTLRGPNLCLWHRPDGECRGGAGRLVGSVILRVRQAVPLLPSFANDVGAFGGNEAGKGNRRLGHERDHQPGTLELA